MDGSHCSPHPQTAPNRWSHSSGGRGGDAASAKSKRHKLRNVDHLVADRFRIIPTQRLATTAAVAGMKCTARKEAGYGLHRYGLPSLRACDRAMLFPFHVGFKPMPSLDGGFEEFLEQRPICSSSWVISRPASDLTVGGVASQSLSEMPAGCGTIMSNVYLRN